MSRSITHTLTPVSSVLETRSLGRTFHLRYFICLFTNFEVVPYVIISSLPSPLRVVPTERPLLYKVDCGLPTFFKGFMKYVQRSELLILRIHHLLTSLDIKKR